MTVMEPYTIAFYIALTLVGATWLASVLVWYWNCLTRRSAIADALPRWFGVLLHFCHGYGVAWTIVLVSFASQAPFVMTARVTAIEWLLSYSHLFRICGVVVLCGMAYLNKAHHSAMIRAFGNEWCAVAALVAAGWAIIFPPPF